MLTTEESLGGVGVKTEKKKSYSCADKVGQQT